MGFHHKEPHVEVMFMQDKIIRDGVHNDVHHSIGAPASGIPEGLYRHQLAEGGIEIIDK